MLYAPVFRRLAGVTQVAGAEEPYGFHNRLTHSLKVAQVARRIAERFQKRKYRAMVASAGGVDPDVVEAAALAHDLGHPPFGHIAEDELDKISRQDTGDGFEGNAQSFRIVTRLEGRFAGTKGLDLTRATLRAILKYPTLRKEPYTDGQKFGAYRSDAEYFEWVMDGRSEGPSIEAQIMDWADDVSYALHDMEDFYKVGLIPLDLLLRSVEERERFFELAKLSLSRKKKDPAAISPEVVSEVGGLFQQFGEIYPSLLRPYEASVIQRAHLRSLVSWLVNRYVTEAVDIQGSSGTAALDIRAAHKAEILCLKELTWVYVIGSSNLAMQQIGHREIVRTLYNSIRTNVSEGELSLLPGAWRELASQNSDRQELARLALDYVSSLTERQALFAYEKLTGAASGTLVGPAMT